MEINQKINYNTIVPALNLEIEKIQDNMLKTQLYLQKADEINVIREDVNNNYYGLFVERKIII